MNQEIKKQWIQALRSGEYKQGKNRLRNGDSYCCLGVLCDIHGKHFSINWEEEPTVRCFEYLNHHTTLPPRVFEWTGLECSNPEVSYGKGKRKCLSCLNDTGTSFEEIANLLEESDPF